MLTGLSEAFQRLKKYFYLSHTVAANKMKMRWLSHFSLVTGKPPASGIRFAVYQKLSDIPAGVWDECNADNDIFLSSRYLAALEQAPPDNMQFRYAVFQENDYPVATAYFQILAIDHRLHRSPGGSGHSGNPGIFKNIHKKIADSISHRILVCGNILLSGEHGYSEREKTEIPILYAIAEAAYAIRKSEAGGISATLIKDFYENNRHSPEILSQFGFHPFDAGPNMIVPIRKNWTSFEEYLKQMKSKYRKRAAGVIKKGLEILKRPLDQDEMLKYKADLFSLYGEVAGRAKFKLFILSPEYFIELKKNLGERFVCDAYFLKDKMIGFSTRIFNRDTVEGYTHGLNYDLNKSYELYQNFLLDDIREAIDGKFSRISTGRTSVAMKSSVGAVPENMKCHIRFSGRITNQLVKPLFYFIKPSGEYCRNPFGD